MSNTSRANERRKHKRIEAREGAFAVLTSDSAYRFGKIINLSHGGLALRYFSLNGQIMDSDEDFSECEVDIFFGTNEFKLGKVPIKIICDYRIAEDVSLSMRQKCLQFKSLTLDQAKKLEYFIWHNQND